MEKPEAIFFHSLPLDAAAEALEETDMDVQKGLIGAVSEEKAEDILDEMDRKKADRVRELLVHSDETAGGLMTTAIVRLRGEKTAGEAIGTARREAGNADVIYYLFAVDEADHLRGITTMKELLRAPEGAPLDGLLTKNVISVGPEADKDEVARLFSKYGFRAIPVIDAEGTLRGVIRFRAIVTALAPELS